MRRRLTTLVALLAIGASTLTIAPVQAAPRMLPAISGGDSTIQLAGGPGDNGYRPGKRYRGDNHHRRDHRHRHRHRHGHNFVSPGFFFPFQFYQAPRRDCYRGWDGRIYCAR